MSENHDAGSLLRPVWFFGPVPRRMQQDREGSRAHPRLDRREEAMEYEFGCDLQDEVVVGRSAISDLAQPVKTGRTRSNACAVQELVQCMRVGARNCHAVIEGIACCRDGFLLFHRRASSKGLQCKM